MFLSDNWDANAAMKFHRPGKAIQLALSCRLLLARFGLPANQSAAPNTPGGGGAKLVKDWPGQLETAKPMDSGSRVGWHPCRTQPDQLRRLRCHGLTDTRRENNEGSGLYISIVCARTGFRGCCNLIGSTLAGQTSMNVHEAASTVSAVVLAGGMSRRMGVPKQLLRFEGKSLLEHTLANVRASAVHEIVLVLGFAADEIEKEISPQGLKITRNESYQQGMGTSLRMGLAAVDPQSTAALIILGDQPFVRPATLDRLIEFHGSLKREIGKRETGKPAAARSQIVIPTYRGFRGNPVLLDRTVFPELQGLSGDMGCRAIFGDHTGGIYRLPVDDAGILLDIDSPEDLEKIDQLRAGLSRGENEILESRQDVSEKKPELVLVGRDSVVHALAQFGCLLRFTVTVVDPFLRLSQIPEADRILRALDFSRLPAAEQRYVIIASRGQFDEEAAWQALQMDISYIAVLAGKQRGRELAKALVAQGIAQEKLTRLHIPAGLEIGAESPEEIALSILAEIISERKRNKQE
jgi:molybdenum cofactor cytidylyltransferase